MPDLALWPSTKAAARRNPRIFEIRPTPRLDCRTVRGLDRALGKGMPSSGIFISSLTRRQLARRRPTRRALSGAVSLPMGLQLILVLLVVIAGFAAFMAGHGGI